MRRLYKHKVNECDGGVCAPVQTLSNTSGEGNVQPAEMSGSTAAEQTDPRTIGSGDKFGSDNKKKRKSLKKKKNSKVDEDFSDVFDSDLTDYSNYYKKSDRDWFVHNFVHNYISYYPKTNQDSVRTYRGMLNRNDEGKLYYIDENYNLHLIGDKDFYISKGKYEWDGYGQKPVFREVKTDLPRLPIKIVECKGSLHAENIGLRTLEGFPKVVEGFFSVEKNKLTTLEGGPEIVSCRYEAGYNKLINLKGMPKEINCKPWLMLTGRLILTGNSTLRSSEGLLDNYNYEISFPSSYFKYSNGTRHPENYISPEEAEEIKTKLKGYYTKFSYNENTYTITIDGDIRISKTAKSDYYLAFRWKIDSSHPREAGFGDHWNVDQLVAEFIKKKNRGTF